MKAYSKLIIFVIVATLVASLFGCAPAATPTAEPTQAAQVEPTKVPPTATAVPPTATEVPPTATAVPPTATPEPEPVTIRYANWNLGTEEENNLQRQLIKAYTDAHPNVTVEVVDMSGEGGWDAILTAKAAAGELPDVFMANNVPLYVSNGWLADMSDMVKDDADWQNVSQALKDGFTYNGKVMGLPAAQFLMGYFVNKDLFEAANLDAPEYGVSADDFFAAVTALNNVPQGVLGMDEQEFVMGWYANTQEIGRAHV